MIKLGKLTDYAVVLMAQIAKEGVEASCSAHYLSQKTLVPEPTVAKILKILAKARLLTSVRGASGGYKMIKKPDQISVAEIIYAMDGPISIVACCDKNSSTESCKARNACHVKDAWGVVNEAIKKALEDVYLSEMIKEFSLEESVAS